MQDPSAEAGRSVPVDGERRAPSRLPVRRGIFSVLVVVYVVVSLIAWSDYPREPTTTPLDDLERAGLGVWRANNCQSCHQLYGFGGFLGPDLTNRVTDETLDVEFDWILVSGSGRMPALDLPKRDREAVLAFLRAMNRTGQSQPTPLGGRREVDPVRHLVQLCEAHCAEAGLEMPPPVRRGSEVWTRMQCGTCHVPLQEGRARAPDLTAMAVDRSVEAVTEVMAKGRNRMPSIDAGPEEIVALCAFLEWTAEHREELRDRNDRMLEREPFRWGGVPWWEYDR